MKYGLILLLFYSLSLQAAPALHLDVTDQNFNSTDKIIIDQDEIQKSRASNLPSLLLTKANIAISTNNVQPNSIYIRGGDSSHVLILVDGVPTYDASSPQRTINLFNLNLAKIKKITVLKGSQSVLYGGQAMSGVIQIETFSEGMENSNTVIADAAVSRDSGQKQTLSANSQTILLDSLILSGSIYGLNAKNNSPVFDATKLYPQKSGVIDLAIKHQGDYVNILKLNYSKDDNEITNSDFTNSKSIDTDDFKAKTDSAGAVWILKKPEVFTFSASIHRIFRAFDQEASKTLLGVVTDQKYEGILSNIRLDGNLYKDDQTRLQGGIQISTESMIFRNNGIEAMNANTQYEGVYLKSDYSLSEKLFFEYGVRQENSKSKALAQSYHLGLVWNKMVKLEYSTGFKTPSLFQLYAAIYGNPNLQPEKSKNLSATIEGQISENIYSSLTYFDSKFENLIDFSFVTNKYNNISLTRTVGVEWQSSLALMENSLRFSLGLGYQEPKDISRNQWLVRRPLHSGSLRANYTLNSDFDLGAEYIYTGEKLDKAGTPYVTLPDYSLVNIFANYKVSEIFTAFARIDNLTQQDYQTTYGFYNQGSIYKLGLQASF